MGLWLSGQASWGQTRTRLVYQPPQLILEVQLPLLQALVLGPAGQACLRLSLTRLFLPHTRAGPIRALQGSGVSLVHEFRFEPEQQLLLMNKQEPVHHEAVLCSICRETQLRQRSHRVPDTHPGAERQTWDRVKASQRYSGGPAAWAWPICN